MKFIDKSASFRGRKVDSDDLYVEFEPSLKVSSKGASGGFPPFPDLQITVSLKDEGVRELNLRFRGIESVDALIAGLQEAKAMCHGIREKNGLNKERVTNG